MALEIHLWKPGVPSEWEVNPQPLLENLQYDWSEKFPPSMLDTDIPKVDALRTGPGGRKARMSKQEIKKKSKNRYDTETPHETHTTHNFFSHSSKQKPPTFPLVHLSIRGCLIGRQIDLSFRFLFPSA